MKSTVGFLIAGEPLPKHGSSIEKLESFIGERPFYDFLFGYLSKELQEQQDYDSAVPVCKLVELEQYSNVSGTAHRLVELFDTLPWLYKFSIKFKSFLSAIFPESTNRFEISETMSLVKPDDKFFEEYPLQSGIGGRDRYLFGGIYLPFFDPKEWDRESVYLQISTSGFVGKYVSTQTTEDVISTFKAFCGLSIAIRLLKVEYSYQIASPKMRFIIHRNIEGKWIIDETEELTENLSSTISDLVFHDLDGKLDNDPKKKLWMLTCLSKLKKVFRNKDQTETEKLILAGQWFFDSYLGRNELLSFVQTMVALEILLGDKAASDVMGLGELLRNRCAYLIGKNHTQHERILGDFKEIYDIRSKIIHRGKSRLTFRERELFNRLQWICRRVIQEEIELIAENAQQ